MERRSLLEELEKRAVEVGSEAGFRSRFEALSRAGDRAGMTRALLEALESGPYGRLKAAPAYRGKNELRAAALLEEDRYAEEGSDPERLTEALARAPSNGPLYLEILARRARAYYRAGASERCLLDCRFFAETYKQLGPARGRSPSVIRALVDVLLLQADCCKARGQVPEARALLNEAMQRIDELARQPSQQQQADDPEAFKYRKAKLLNDFLRYKPDNALQPIDSRRLQAQQEEKKVPALDGRINKFLSNCSDAVALGIDKEKGRMLCATRNIKAGSVIIVDRPFAYCTDIAALQRNCLFCHVSLRLENTISVPCESCKTVRFCSKDCQQRAWTKFHKYECRIFDYFFENKVQRTNSFLAYRTVVTAAIQVEDDILKINREFLQLHSDDNKTFDVTALKKYESQDYKTVFSLETNCARADPNDNFERVVHSILFAKCLIYSLTHFHPGVEDYEDHLYILAVALFHNMQAINCNAYEIVENVRDNETKVLEPRNIGGAVYTSVSLTNHSCYPNVVRHSYPCGKVVVQTLRFIPQGGEILDCYGQHFLENKRDSRRKLLEKKYYFKCQCVACTYDWPLTLPSDQFNFKCKVCYKQCRKTRNVVECTDCSQKIEISKLYALLQTSIKKRLTALTKMYDSNYQDALPLLLEHANSIDKLLSEPSLEAIKTQQSIIQCLNAMSSTSV